VLSLNAEQSMFGAGDLNSPTPYGLTKAEKVIVKNKKTIKSNEKTLKNNKKKINKVDVKINDLEEKLNGLDSILESESIKLNKVYLNLNKHLTSYKYSSKTWTKDIQNINNNLKNTNDNIENLQFQIEKNRENISILKLSFDKMVVLMNEINNSYITKKEFQKLISILDKKEKSKKSKHNKSKKSLLTEVRVLFKKSYFTKALPILEYLIEKKYRPAECNYYVGEIKYYRKKYQDALYYFKKSMTLYDKAKYLPKLLLHSAISFDKLDDIENAQNFYNTIIDIYPESQEAKEASKKIIN
jgi:tetratricopeptide (TPR) repeat protein